MLGTGQICLFKPEFATMELDDLVNMDFVQISDSLICSMVVYEINKDNRTLMNLACRRLILLSLSVTLNMCGLRGLIVFLGDQNTKTQKIRMSKITLSKRTSKVREIRLLTFWSFLMP